MIEPVQARAILHTASRDGLTLKEEKKEKKETARL